MLALVVGRASPVKPPVQLGHRPRSGALLPGLVHAVDDVAVTVTQHGRNAVALKSLRDQERRRAVEMLDADGEPQLFQERLDLVGEIGLDIVGARGVLAFGLETDATSEVGGELPAVEIVGRARNRILPAH